MTEKAILIIGDGVAGMAAARHLLLAGQRPILVAPIAAVPSRGETLSPRALPVLRALGWRELLDEIVALAQIGRFSVWSSPVLRQSETDREGGFHVDRARLEAGMAANLAGENILRHRQKVVGLDHAADGVVVRLADGAALTADAVIDCSGRAAISSGPRANRRRMDRLTALWTVLDIPRDTETLAATLVEACEGGWWYSAVLPGHRLMVGLFTDSDLLPAGASRDGALFWTMLAEAGATSQRVTSLGLAPLIEPASLVVSPAATIAGSAMIEGRILRAGDAAAATDPLAANGLATALWSGAQAAEAGLALVRGDLEKASRYERLYLDGIARQLAAQAGLYAAETRFASAPFWQRRNRSVTEWTERATAR